MKISTCTYDLKQLLHDLVEVVWFNDFAFLDPLTVKVNGNHGWNFKLKRSPAGKSVTVALPIWSGSEATPQFYYTWRAMRPATDVPWHTADIAARINRNRAEWMANIDGVEQTRLQSVLEETVPCKICGDPTTMLGTKMCDCCWAVSNNFHYLVAQHPEAAKRWLEQQLHLLNTPKIRVLDPPQGLNEHYVQFGANGSVPCRNDLDCVFCKIAKEKVSQP